MSNDRSSDLPPRSDLRAQLVVPASSGKDFPAGLASLNGNASGVVIGEAFGSISNAVLGSLRPADALDQSKLESLRDYACLRAEGISYAYDVLGSGRVRGVRHAPEDRDRWAVGSVVMDHGSHVARGIRFCHLETPGIP